MEQRPSDDLILYTNPAEGSVIVKFTFQFQYQCRNSPTLPLQNACKGPMMVISNKRTLKRCCISGIIFHDLIVVVISLSRG